MLTLFWNTYWYGSPEITPRVVGTRRRREIMTHLQVVSRPEIFCEVITAFDGQKNLFTYPHLPMDNGHCIVSCVHTKLTMADDCTTYRLT